ncbi:MAG: metal ABC transporter permease [Lachnospiraceae bacterium]
MSILQYGFMQRAIIVGILLAIAAPCVGMTIVLKRKSMIGDALSHSSLAGVALGLLLGINPILGATGICIMAALAIEAIQKKIPRYSEMAISIIMSAGIGLAGVLSGFVKNSANFNSFLFGSIVSVSMAEVWAVAGISCAVILIVFVLYQELFYISFDERAARLSGVPVRTVNFIFTLLTALTVSVSSRTVGALIVSSLLVLPIACSMQLERSYKFTIISAIGFSVFFTLFGLIFSYYAQWKPGGTIVLTGVICFILLVTIKSVLRRIRAS